MSLVCCLAVLIAGLAGCGGAKAPEAALRVNEAADVDTELFTYFLSMQYYGGEAVGDAEKVEAATADCLAYLAVNTRFVGMGLALSQEDKAEVSLETDSLWRLYGGYLSALGVSKQTYFKVRQYLRMRENLEYALYDKDGVSPISDSYLREYFLQNYVGIKYFYEELYPEYTEQQLAALSDGQLKSLNERMNYAAERYQYISDLATYVNSGIYTIDQAYMAVTENVSENVSVETTVVSRSDTNFTREFITAVFKQASGSAFLVTNNSKSYVYFVQRVDLFSEGTDLFDAYRDQCLQAVADAYLTQDVADWVSSYKAVRYASATDQCLDRVKRVDRAAYIGTDAYEFKPLDGLT